VPGKVHPSGKDVTRSLFSVANSNKDSLINGSTNAGSASALEHFFYFNIFPKLQAHGLADNEKVAGVRYRRSFLNKAGRALFANYERRTLLAKAANEAGLAPAIENNRSEIEAAQPRKRSSSKKRGTPATKKSL
jgi:hypothetical protein